MLSGAPFLVEFNDFVDHSPAFEAISYLRIALYAVRFRVFRFLQINLRANLTLNYIFRRALIVTMGSLIYLSLILVYIISTKQLFEVKFFSFIFPSNGHRLGR